MKNKRRVKMMIEAVDLSHAGYIKLLEEARGIGDYLVKGLQSIPTLDGPEKNQPI